MAEQSGEKTFDATPHRREEARKKGQVAFSQDLGSAALLLVAALVLRGLGRGVVEAAAKLMQRQLGDLSSLTLDRSGVLSQAMGFGQAIGLAVAPILGLLLLAGVAASVLQVGFLFVPSRLAPDASRISPLQGLKRIFSVTGAAKLGFGIFKVLVVAAVSVSVLWARAEDVLGAGALPIGECAQLLAGVTIDTLFWVGAALFILALADYAVQKWKHEQDLKMTHQEIKEEMKNQQGDPQVVARRKQIQRQMALNRMGDAVPKADVVVTNPTELAVALQYDPETMAAPVVLAKGAGVIAQRIRRLALENSVPGVERKPLA
ncbi:MAG: EscU/YscU/HrcU family type III secretion system export apparatus switch protein, partial [Planctomycetota bacterium]